MFKQSKWSIIDSILMKDDSILKEESKSWRRLSINHGTISFNYTSVYKNVASPKKRLNLFSNEKDIKRIYKHLHFLLLNVDPSNHQFEPEYILLGEFMCAEVSIKYR